VHTCIADPSVMTSPTEKATSTEYGYEQIINYAKKQKGKSVAQKHWVDLPRGIEVVTFPRAQALSTVESSEFPSKEALKGLPYLNIEDGMMLRLSSNSMMPRVSSNSSVSTMASDSDNKCVRFSDGFEVEGSTSNLDGKNVAPLAEWIYIDRDICGCSLYQYDPTNVRKRAYASSDYGRLFLEELLALEAQIKLEREEATARSLLGLTHDEEESMLDEALKQAGVKELVLLFEAK